MTAVVPRIDPDRSPEPPMTPRVSCVVVSYHRAVALDRLLGRLDDPDLEVIVVDVDDDPDVAAVAVRHGAALVALPGNPGYAAAVNRGVEVAAAAVVVFMNDDLRVDAATVADLAAVVSRHEADVAVPALLTPDRTLERTVTALATPGSLLREWALLPDEPPHRLADRVTSHVQKWRAPRRPEQVDAACGAIVAVSTELLKREPLPEQYFLYWEEVEWFWRLGERGATVQYRPELTVVHEGGRGDVRPDKSRLLARNAVRCVRRTQGRGAAARAVPVVVLWNTRLLAFAVVRCLRGPGPVRRQVVAARWAGLMAAFGSVAEIRGHRS